MRRLVLVLLIGLIFTIAGAQAEAAKPSSAITVAPFLQNIRIQANEPTKSFKLTIRNDTDQTQSLHLSVLNFGSLNETGGIAFTGNNTNSLIKKYGIASWLKLSNSDLTLEPSKSADVEATIINDVSLSPGGHYGAIVASVNSQSATSGTPVNVKQELSSLVFATKVGGEKYDLELDSASYATNWGRVPSAVSLRFKNTGNVQVVPRGIVKLISPRGHVISQGTINEASSYVLPETYRRIPANLTSIASEGWWPKFYRLEVYYRYEGIDSFAVKTYTLYLVNLPLTVLTLVLFVALTYVGYRLMRYVMWRRSRPKPVPIVAYKKPSVATKSKRATKKPKKFTKKKSAKAKD